MDNQSIINEKINADIDRKIEIVMNDLEVTKEFVRDNWDSIIQQDWIFTNEYVQESLLEGERLETAIGWAFKNERDLQSQYRGEIVDIFDALCD